MILIHRHSFQIASYHHQRHPEDAEQELAQGLVIAVELEFESWLAGRRLPADAFIDSGADSSLLSLRWMEEQARLAATEVKAPRSAPEGYVTEGAGIWIGGQRLELGTPDCPVWLGRQGDAVGSAPWMPGYEDVLLGRDFLAQHGLLLVIDGEARQASLLAPYDSDNRSRRKRILAALE